jgi:tRNA A37 methylthiotransferase MiaB
LYEEELVELAESGLIKSILCPVQSGSNRILQLMEREHSANDIQKTLKKLHNIYPQLQLNTQVIVGYPSETEEEFGETLDFIKDLGFNYVVVFPYHDKENTVASRLKNKVPERIIDQRIKRLKRYLKHEKVKIYFKCP